MDRRVKGADGLRQRAKRVLGIGFRAEAVTADGLPLIAVRGDGALVEDVSGRQFVDWNMGFGSLLLGYRHAGVEAAIAQQLAGGTVFSFPHRLEIEVAEQLCALIPCAEKVAFGKNGSDVCAAAVRVARAVTGREAVLQYGYHGFHDWSVATNRNAEGVPPVLRSLVHPLVYGDVEGLRGIFAEHGARIAAVIMEPMRETLPPPGYLEAVRALTAAQGSLLVFDELVTGFRVARGGAQSRFGVTPDLACFGKAMSNGMPLSALVGRADLIDMLPRVAYGMTMRGETLALAAARAALDVYAHEDVAGRVTAIGGALRERFTALCAQRGIDASLVGHPSMQTLVLPAGWREPFLTRCRELGVFSYGHLLPSVAHGEAELTATLAAFELALDDCASRR